MWMKLPRTRGVELVEYKSKGRMKNGILCEGRMKEWRWAREGRRERGSGEEPRLCADILTSYLNSVCR